jgi:3-oxoacyl-[acyl-carrier protein] reductase
VSDESILITGASSDIGEALVRRLAASNAARPLICHYSSGRTRIEELQKELGPSIVPMRGDFSSSASIDAFIESLRAANVAPYSFVHLPASKLRYERFSKQTRLQFERDWQIQVGSAIAILQYSLAGQKRLSDKQLPRRRVVFALSSVTLGTPPKYLSMYTAIKYAQLGLMRSLAVEYGDLGVSVNAVSPSMVETQLLSEVPRQIVETSQSQNPMGRNATPGDVAAVIEFLLSDQADFINGANVPVTGGSIL